MSARTATPRFTAAASASATSLRSRRKMRMSMVLRARLMPARTGRMPASGSTISFTQLIDAFSGPVERPRDGWMRNRMSTARFEHEGARMSDKRRELRSGTPIWLSARTPIERRYPALAGRHQAEVAIVGGGITGALVAQAFADAGVSVALVERDLVATGSTAASSALLLQEPDLGLDELQRKYGVETGRHLWRLSQNAARDLIALLRRLDIRCDLTTR